MHATVYKCCYDHHTLPTLPVHFLPFCRYSASLADEMDGQDMHRTVHISSVPQRTTSPDQQIEVKITTKKAAAFPGDSATRK